MTYSIPLSDQYTYTTTGFSMWTEVCAKLKLTYFLLKLYYTSRHHTRKTGTSFFINHLFVMASKDMFKKLWKHCPNKIMHTYMHKIHFRDIHVYRTVIFSNDVSPFTLHVSSYNTSLYFKAEITFSRLLHYFPCWNTSKMVLFFR